MAKSYFAILGVTVGASLVRSDPLIGDWPKNIIRIVLKGTVPLSRKSRKPTMYWVIRLEGDNTRKLCSYPKKTDKAPSQESPEPLIPEQRRWILVKYHRSDHSSGLRLLMMKCSIGFGTTFQEWIGPNPAVSRI